MVHFASDHAGFEMKNNLLAFVHDELKLPVKDHGAFTYDENDDYPEFINKAAEETSKEPLDRAIILGGSGQGEAMVANRIKGIRCTVYYGGKEEIIRLSRQHNDANVLSLGARFVSEEEAKNAVKIWLSTDFSGEERHTRRLAELEGGKHNLAANIFGFILKK